MPKTRNKNSATLTGIRTVRSAPSPRTTCLPCAAGGKKHFQQTQRYYNTMLGHYGAAPATATPELCEEVVRNHLHSNSILCILSLQDWMSMDGKWRNPNVQEERINIPANPRHYWRWRIPDTGTTDEGRKLERENKVHDRKHRKIRKC